MAESQLEEIYRHLWVAHTDEFGVLDQSLKPRSWAMLFDIVAGWNVDADSTVLDVGCGRGNHCLDFATRFGCHAVGLDRVFSPLGRTRSIAREQGYGDLVAYLQGSIDHLPFGDESFDLLWCRDVLAHVRDLPRALGECARVLKAHSPMLVFTTLATDLIEPRERERLSTALAIIPESLDRAALEQAIATAGFNIDSRQDIGSELMEYYEERDRRASRELMRIARMLRNREKLVKEWGASRFETAQALYHWMVYLLLGKLTSTIYALKKAS
jgi:ubiquinone/menaquinone biosynthesis C-methylase UbiE